MLDLESISGVRLQVILIVILILGIRHLVISRTRYPNVPVLKVSQKPGIFGRFEDIQSFVLDNMKLCNVGWERYSKHGKNYLMNTPTGKYLVVAPRFTDEVIRAPDDILNAEETQNLVS
jgi:hypothetical protein